jgi:hypothetical protein
MCNEEHEPRLLDLPLPEDLAGLLTCLQETPNTLLALIDEFRCLSEPPALAGGPVSSLSEPPASAGGPVQSLSEPPASAGEPVVGVLRPEGPPANAGGSDKYFALRWRNSDDEFSALENVCHLRDIEAEGYAIRIDRILDETNPFLADIDGGRLAIERSYKDQDPNLALRDFIGARTKNLEKLRGVDTEDFEREGTLQGVGLVTLKRLLEMMCEHDEGHIEELRVLRQTLKRRASYRGTKKCGLKT